MPLGLFRPAYAPAGDPPASAAPLVGALGRGLTVAGEQYQRDRDAAQSDAVTALRTDVALGGFDAAVSEAEARRVLILAAARIAAAADPAGSGAPPQGGVTAAIPQPYVATPATPAPAPATPPRAASAGWIALGLTGAAAAAGLLVWKASGA